MLRFMRSACGPIFRAIAAHTAGPLAVSASRSHRADRLPRIRIWASAVSALRNAANAMTCSGRSSMAAGAHFSTGLSISQPNMARRALSFGVGRARRSTSRRLGSLPIDADSSFSTEAEFSHRWTARWSE